MPVHAQPGDAVFLSCQQLFRDYPLAVRRHYAEFRYGSMVLASRGPGTGPPRFTVLIMERDDLFVARPWDRRDWPRAEIRRGEPADAGLARLIESSVPVPREGSMLCWLGDGQVRAILVAYGRLPEPWDDPSAVPGIAVLPPASGDPARWPPLPEGLLEERQVWEQAGRGQLADLVMLTGREPASRSWCPAGSAPTGAASSSPSAWAATGAGCWPGSTPTTARCARASGCPRPGSYWRCQASSTWPGACRNRWSARGHYPGS